MHTDAHRQQELVKKKGGEKAERARRKWDVSKIKETGIG